MHLHLTLSQLTLVAGTALAVALVLIFLIFLLHKIVKEGRAASNFRARTPRAENQSAFVAATVQGVIADLKTAQKAQESRLRSAEKQMRISQRIFELVAEQIGEGLLVIGADGIPQRANAALREMLRADLWSKRPFAEVLGRESPLTALIQECMASGRPAKGMVKIETDRAAYLMLEASVAPILDATGSLEGAVCFLRPVEANSRAMATPSASESGS